MRIEHLFEPRDQFRPAGVHSMEIWLHAPCEVISQRHVHLSVHVPVDPHLFETSFIRGTRTRVVRVQVLGRTPVKNQTKRAHLREPRFEIIRTWQPTIRRRFLICGKEDRKFPRSFGLVQEQRFGEVSSTPSTPTCSIRRAHRGYRWWRARGTCCRRQNCWRRLQAGCVNSH